MNDKNTGGQAFPKATDAFAVSRGDGGGANYKIRTENGMTLRDYFAAKAMQGIVADPDLAMGCNKIAEWAYTQADAMLQARNN